MAFKQSSPVRARHASLPAVQVSEMADSVETTLLLACDLLADNRDVAAFGNELAASKTALVFPMLRKIFQDHKKSARRAVRVLILVPSEDSAKHVERMLEGESDFADLRIVSLITEDGKSNSLGAGADIVIAIPAAAQAALESNTIKPGKIQLLVMEESENLLTDSECGAVRQIREFMPDKFQTLALSETLPPEIRANAESVLNQPVILSFGDTDEVEELQISGIKSVPPISEVMSNKEDDEDIDDSIGNRMLNNGNNSANAADSGKRRNPEKQPSESVSTDSLERRVVRIRQEKKYDLLLHLLKERQGERTLVFTRTKFIANAVSQQLAKDGVPSATIHSNRTEKQRDRAFDGFNGGDIKTLIATDMAIERISPDFGAIYIISYDAPAFPHDYANRVAQAATVLAGVTTFVVPEEENQVGFIEETVGESFTWENVKGFDLSAPPSVVIEDRIPHNWHSTRKQVEQAPPPRRFEGKGGFRPPPDRADRLDRAPAPPRRAPAGRAPYPEQSNRPSNGANGRRPQQDDRNNRPKFGQNFERRPADDRRPDNRNRPGFRDRNDSGPYKPRENRGEFHSDNRDNRGENWRENRGNQKFRSPNNRPPQPKRSTQPDNPYDQPSESWRSSEFYATLPTPYKPRRRPEERSTPNPQRRDSSYYNDDNRGNTAPKKKFTWNPFKKKNDGQ